jgi:hypothetical protein
VTVCIAAIARDGYANEPERGDEVIVSVSDKKLTLFYTSGDGVVSKRFHFHSEWTALMAGSDITPCVEIMQAATGLLSGKHNTLRNIASAVKTAYQNRLQELIEDRILSRYGMKLQEFKASGKNQLTVEIFNSICSQIDNTSLECEFLVFGFDDNKIPHIFVVTNPGIVNVYDKPGFWAIGSGASAALSMLFYRGQNEDTEMEKALYHACEAKFMAETASDVGIETQFFISKHGHDTMSHKSTLLEVIRREWEKQGKPKFPRNVIKRIKELEIELTKGPVG